MFLGYEYTIKKVPVINLKHSIINGLSGAVYSSGIVNSVCIALFFNVQVYYFSLSVSDIAGLSVIFVDR
jgi:hypothetical protein